LAEVLGNMFEKFGNQVDAFYEKVHTYVLNPKAITMDELYGGIDKLTLEWHDGLMATTIRHCVQVSYGYMTLCAGGLWLYDTACRWVMVI